MLAPENRIDRRILLEGRALRQTGFRVTIIAAPRPAGEVDDDDFPELDIVRLDLQARVPLQVNWADALPPRDWNAVYWLTDRFYLAAVTRPAEVYVAHDLPVLPAALMAALLHGSLLVYDAHELFPEQHWIEEPRRRMLAEVEAELIRLVHHGVTVNESLAREIAQRYGVPEFMVILNAPARLLEPHEPPGDLLRRALGIPADRLILLFQGGLVDHRNLELLVEAMARVRNERVILVFLGDGALHASLEERAAQLGLLGSRVRFHPFVPQRQLLLYTRCADAGIVPYPHVDLNSYYCTPNKLFEYLAVGVPVLANESPELRRFVGDLGTGLNRPMTDAAGIAQAIDDLFDDEDRLASFRRRADEVGPALTWDAEATKLVTAYRTWVADRRRARRPVPAGSV